MSFSIYRQTHDWASAGQLPLHAQDSVGSTNDWAKEEALNRPIGEIHLYLADHQTQGRGRGSNTWNDVGAGSALLSTWSFGLTLAPQPILAPSLGLALFRAAVATFPDLSFSLKPPNDLFCGDRKIAGLLVETVQQGNQARLLVGLGLNVWTTPEKLPEAGCLVDFSGRERLTPLVWNSFLDRLLIEMVSTLHETRDALTPNQRASLCHAINLYPRLRSRVKEVHADGGLTLESGQQIGWQSL